jgi:hypothetical protein
MGWTEYSGTDKDDLTTVKTWLRQNSDIKGGCICPACSRRVKAYKRGIHATMAKALIEMYRIALRENPTDVTSVWVRYNRMWGNTGDFARLRWPWQFIEPKPNTDPDKKGSGYWRLTEAGVAFVLGRLQVPKSAIFYYQNKFLRWDDPEAKINIEGALGKKFSYQALMAGLDLPDKPAASSVPE